MEEQPLGGGNSSVVVRAGDTVRRPAGEWTASVARFMNTLVDAGLEEVPAHLGIDEQNREMVRFIEGEAGQYPLADWVWSDQILSDAGRLMRRMHDASVVLLDQPSPWQTGPHEPAEVICHNDFAPYNMVFRQQRLVGIIDFDRASPGPRLWDLAFLAYHLVPLSKGGMPKRMRAERLRSLLGAYGTDAQPSELIAVAAERLAELADWTENHARETSRADLQAHAEHYRRDAARMRSGVGA